MDISPAEDTAEHTTDAIEEVQFEDDPAEYKVETAAEIIARVKSSLSTPQIHLKKLLSLYRRITDTSKPLEYRLAHCTVFADIAWWYVVWQHDPSCVTLRMPTTTIKLNMYADALGTPRVRDVFSEILADPLYREIIADESPILLRTPDVDGVSARLADTAAVFKRVLNYALTMDPRLVQAALNTIEKNVGDFSVVSSVAVL